MDKKYYHKLSDGSKYPDLEEMVIYLLNDGILFVGNGDTIKLLLNCNDVFIPASDAENVTEAELPVLFKLCRESKYGYVKWSCIKRNEKPRKCVINKMKTAGDWNVVLENIPENKFEKNIDNFRNTK
jgi:hypothetical protein